MKAKLKQLERLNDTIRTCICMYDTMIDVDLKAADRYLQAAELAGKKFDSITREINSNGTRTVYIKH